MKARKFDRYADKLGNCLDIVEDAIESGVLLTSLEMFDYNFKSVLYSGSSYWKIRKSIPYRVAVFYAEVFTTVHELRVEGYSTKEYKMFLRDLMHRARVLKISNGYSVNAYDLNGVLYVGMYRGGKLEDEVGITDVDSMSAVTYALASHIVKDSIEDKELRGMCESYLLDVHREVMSATEPTPYVYKGTAKTLSRYLSKKNIREESKGTSGNIVQFRIG